MTHQEKTTGSSLIKLTARNIKLLRLKKGLSQEELAEMSGYHRTYIGSVERGERNITLTTLETLANSLEIEPFALLKETDDF